VHDESDCDVVKAMRSWWDIVAIQEEHSELPALDFLKTQERVGWIEHQRCILPLIEECADQVMDSPNEAVAYLLIKSALCQIALICFVMGRQHEGAEV
jgi:Asp-tRNA(Asn)/Glu-tRNA(Gln) amidotransferase B subunit